jgi:hypothetical protein
MLSSRSNAFLRIEGAPQLGHFRMRIDCAKKDCFILAEYHTSEGGKREGNLPDSSRHWRKVKLDRRMGS